MVEKQSVSELIHQYNTDESNSPATKEIQELVLEMIYFFPQQYFSLPEEDSAEFVLFIYPDLKRIIKNYRMEAGSFEGYLYKIIKKRIKIFYLSKQRENLTRNVFETAQALDMSDGYVIRDDSLVYEGEAFRILMFLLNSSESAKRKFFVTFISISPFMSYIDKERFCRLFGFDLRQTMSLCRTLEKKTSKSIEALDKMRMKRTLYFSKYLLNANLCVSEKAERSLMIRNREIEEISNTVKRANFQDVGELLHLARTTVGNYLYYSRNILTWVLDVYSTQFIPKDLGIEPFLYNLIRANRERIINDGNVKPKRILYPNNLFKQN